MTLQTDACFSNTPVKDNATQTELFSMQRYVKSIAEYVNPGLREKAKQYLKELSLA
jgi:hypothetical protein